MIEGHIYECIGEAPTMQNRAGLWFDLGFVTVNSLEDQRITINYMNGLFLFQ